MIDAAKMQTVEACNAMLATHPVIGYVCNNSRPGAFAFMVFLELRHFPPGTVLNEDFQIVMVRFDEMVWSTVIIPRSKAHAAEAILGELGLRRADGIPHVISGAGVERFPLDAANLFTVEYTHGHFAYRNGSEIAIAIAKENEAVDAERSKFFSQKAAWKCERCESSAGPWQQPNLCTSCA